MGQDGNAGGPNGDNPRRLGNAAAIEEIIVIRRNEKADGKRSQTVEDE